LLRLWRWASAGAKEEPNRPFAVRIATAAYLALCVISFAYFYPVLGYVVIPQKTWQEHMWLPWGCNPGQKQDCIGWI
jgi:dolichyl-phosphate-mannose--protein O-mannosyl transferase